MGHKILGSISLSSQETLISFINDELANMYHITNNSNTKSHRPNVSNVLPSDQTYLKKKLGPPMHPIYWATVFNQNWVYLRIIQIKV